MQTPTSPRTNDTKSETKAGKPDTSVPKLVFYGAPMSSATPVLHALHELDVPFEHVLVDITKGEQHTDAFRALNPNAKVPTLVVDGTPMFEAAAILQWLGDRLGVSRGVWFGFDDPKRLEAVAWTTWAYVTPGAMLQRLNWSRGERVDPSLHHAPTAAHALAELDRHVAILDARLAGRTASVGDAALVGDHFTLVDLAVGSMITYGTYCGLSVEAYPHVKAWLARFHARPAFARAWS